MIRTVIVDDDYRVAGLHRAYAERMRGFCVVGEARSGEEALALVQRVNPDLVLLDIYLPEWRAWTCCGRFERRGDPILT